LFVSRRDRWVAPAEDGGILIDPPLDRVEELLETNRQRFAAANFRIAGQSFQHYRRFLQSEWLPSGPVVATGHQPDFVHPGVWIKNFAAYGIAHRLGLRSFELILDTDTRKSVALPLPTYGATPDDVGVRRPDYDVWRGERMFAWAPVQSPEHFLSFDESSRSIWCDWPFEPLLPAFWGEIRKRWAEYNKTFPDPSEPRAELSDCFWSARDAYEKKWGVDKGGLTMACLYPLKDYYAHFLNDLPRFHSVYNSSVRDYRRRHGLRSAKHPVPDLAEDSGYLEAPFWFVGRGKRHRGFVRVWGEKIAVRIAGVAAGYECDREDLMRVLEELNFTIFPRALMTTLFLRLFLSDLFIHGIGGAKYDEVTDDIIRRYFGIEPPEYIVVSGTLRLPFPTFPATIDERQKLWRKSRDLRWHPELFIDAPNDLVEQKRRWLERAPMTRDERRARYRELLHLTEALRPMVADQITGVEARLARCDQELAANEILTRRDYPFVLYPESKLRPFLTQLL
jgi:hypothetical protein